MARIARVVIPGYPHHITQRGCRRQQTFFADSDYRYYLELLKHAAASANVAVWAYCLMPNHVHLVAVPQNKNSLSKFMGPAHRQFALTINSRMGWQGHLWQERFHSFVMDENYLYAAVRYVELNPVRACLCASAEQWCWSSARAHLSGRDDLLVQVAPMLERVENWNDYLSCQGISVADERIRRHTGTGRPAGDAGFVEKIETLAQRHLKKKKPGPKPRN
jgi:putative transposase